MSRGKDKKPRKKPVRRPAEKTDIFRMRISKSDKENIVKLTKQLNIKKYSKAIRYAVDLAIAQGEKINAH